MLDHDDGFDALVAAVTRLCACYRRRDALRS